MSVAADQRPAEANPGRGKKSILIKASPEWHAWFTRLAESSRMPGVTLIDRALTEWAQRDGFAEPPPRR
jgi:hypothetical protein